MLCTLPVVFSILLLERIQHELPELLRGGVGTSKIIAYFFLLMPSLLPVTVPVSVFVGTLFSLMKLQRNGEITAMRSSGMTIFAITKTIWLSGVIAALFLRLMSATLLPYVDGEMQSLAAELKSQNPEFGRGDVHIRNVAFDGREGRRVWFIGDLDLLAGAASSIDICAYDGDGNVLGKIHAQTGTYVNGTWELKEVNEWMANGPMVPLVGDVPVGEYFQNLHESPELIALCQKRIRAISMHKLRMILSHIPEDDRSRTAYATAYHGANAGCWSCLVSLFCAIPFALGRRRANSYGAISKAAGLLIAFHLLSSCCQALGANALLDPIVAAWLPNVAVALFGLAMLSSVR
jgi:lipopolysaccharide export system permease protein